MNGGNLEIRNLTFAEGGEYECIVKSAVGRISTKTHIVVEGPPGPPGIYHYLKSIYRCRKKFDIYFEEMD